MSLADKLQSIQSLLNQQFEALLNKKSSIQFDQKSIDSLMAEMFQISQNSKNDFSQLLNNWPQTSDSQKFQQQPMSSTFITETHFLAPMDHFISSTLMLNSYSQLDDTITQLISKLLTDYKTFEGSRLCLQTYAQDPNIFKKIGGYIWRVSQEQINEKYVKQFQREVIPIVQLLPFVFQNTPATIQQEVLDSLSLLLSCAERHVLKQFTLNSITRCHLLQKSSRTLEKITSNLNLINKWLGVSKHAAATYQVLTEYTITNPQHLKTKDGTKFLQSLVDNPNQSLMPLVRLTCSLCYGSDTLGGPVMSNLVINDQYTFLLCTYFLNFLKNFKFDLKEIKSVMDSLYYKKFDLDNNTIYMNKEYQQTSYFDIQPIIAMSDGINLCFEQFTCLQLLIHSNVKFFMDMAYPKLLLDQQLLLILLISNLNTDKLEIDLNINKNMENLKELLKRQPVMLLNGIFQKKFDHRLFNLFQQLSDFKFMPSNTFDKMLLWILTGDQDTATLDVQINIIILLLTTTRKHDSGAQIDKIVQCLLKLLKLQVNIEQSQTKLEHTLIAIYLTDFSLQYNDKIRQTIQQIFIVIAQQSINYNGISTLQLQEALSTIQRTIQYIRSQEQEVDNIICYLFANIIRIPTDQVMRDRYIVACVFRPDNNYSEKFKIMQSDIPQLSQKYQQIIEDCNDFQLSEFTEISSEQSPLFDGACLDINDVISYYSSAVDIFDNKLFTEGMNMLLQTESTKSIPDAWLTHFVKSCYKSGVLQTEKLLHYRVLIPIIRQIQSDFILVGNNIEKLQQPYLYVHTFSQSSLFCITLLCSYIMSSKDKFDDDVISLILYPLIRILLDIPLMYSNATLLMERLMVHKKGTLKRGNSINLFSPIQTVVQTKQDLSQKLMDYIVNQKSGADKFRVNYIMNFIQSDQFNTFVISNIKETFLQSEVSSINQIKLVNYMMLRMIQNNNAVINFYMQLPNDYLQERQGDEIEKMVTMPKIATINNVSTFATSNTSLTVSESLKPKEESEISLIQSRLLLLNTVHQLSFEEQIDITFFTELIKPYVEKSSENDIQLFEWIYTQLFKNVRSYEKLLAILFLLFKGFSKDSHPLQRGSSLNSAAKPNYDLEDDQDDVTQRTTAFPEMCDIQIPNKYQEMDTIDKFKLYILRALNNTMLNGTFLPLKHADFTIRLDLSMLLEGGLKQDIFVHSIPAKQIIIDLFQCEKFNQKYFETIYAKRDLSSRLIFAFSGNIDKISCRQYFAMSAVLASLSILSFHKHYANDTVMLIRNLINCQSLSEVWRDYLKEYETQILITDATSWCIELLQKCSILAPGILYFTKYLQVPQLRPVQSKIVMAVSRAFFKNNYSITRSKGIFRQFYDDSSSVTLEKDTTEFSNYNDGISFQFDTKYNNFSELFLRLLLESSSLFQFSELDSIVQLIIQDVSQFEEELQITTFIKFLEFYGNSQTFQDRFNITNKMKPKTIVIREKKKSLKLQKPENQKSIREVNTSIKSNHTQEQFAHISETFNCRFNLEIVERIFELRSGSAFDQTVQTLLGFIYVPKVSQDEKSLLQSRKCVFESVYSLAAKSLLARIVSANKIKQIRNELFYVSMAAIFINGIQKKYDHQVTSQEQNDDSVSNSGKLF
ncbi:Conserved_hypothetical protein [Hexamita inflata]|uniref:Uncharacterized protein n=1 Tax=Hexamita inflata TaxID=28002 RepID=A0AA86P3E2_9EUKA|nr:Conserved hypothetical protein [Hexamita inflata]